MTALAFLVGVLVGLYVGTLDHWLLPTLRRVTRERNDAWARLERRSERRVEVGR